MIHVQGSSPQVVKSPDTAAALYEEIEGILYGQSRYGLCARVLRHYQRCVDPMMVYVRPTLNRDSCLLLVGITKRIG